MTSKLKTSKQLERHLKGVANHWRITILLLVGKSTDLTVDEIASEVGGNFKTISEHIRRLVHAGLINKTNRGREVTHSLSPYGSKILSFLITFQHS